MLSDPEASKTDAERERRESVDRWQLPDWICSRCEFHNLAARLKCRNCGSPGSRIFDVATETGTTLK